MLVSSNTKKEIITIIKATKLRHFHNMLCETYVPFGRAMATSSSDFDSSMHYSKHTFLSLLELGACDATIFGFVGSGSSVHCSKQRARAIWNHAKWDLIIKSMLYFCSYRPKVNYSHNMRIASNVSHLVICPIKPRKRNMVN